MNNDLISREALLKYVSGCEIHVNGEYAYGAIKRLYEDAFKAVQKSIEDAIRIAHAVDAEPVRHGWWKENGPDWVCSYCGMEFKDEIEFIKLDYDYYMPHYCPHCGAKMDGGFEDVDN